MKANEFVKRHGYKHCKSACAQNGWLNTGFWVQLKRLVESHELVEKHGGYEVVREMIDHPICFGDSNIELEIRLNEAIADVESCLEADKKLEGL